MHSLNKVFCWGEFHPYSTLLWLIKYRLQGSHSKFRLLLELQATISAHCLLPNEFAQVLRLCEDAAISYLAVTYLCLIALPVLPHELGVAATLLGSYMARRLRVPWQSTLTTHGWVQRLRPVIHINRHNVSLRSLALELHFYLRRGHLLIWVEIHNNHIIVLLPMQVYTNHPWLYTL